LPSGWEWTRLGELKEFSLYGPRFSSDDYAPDGYLVLRTSDISEGGKVDVSTAPRLRLDEAEYHRYAAKLGDLLITRTGSLGTLAVFADNVAAIPGAYLIQFRLKAPLITSWYVFYLLKSQEGQAALIGGGAGVGRPNLNAPKIEAIPIPLAPVQEQSRIVATVEQHLSDIDAGVAALKRALLNHKRYRASILKDACEGRLAPTEAELARKEGRPYEAADVLLERIHRERREHWESKKRRGTYEVPRAADETGLPALPAGWAWTALDSYLSGIESGSSFKCDERVPHDGEVGVVKVSAVTWGTYDEDESKTCTDPERVDPALYVAPGDFLFSRANTIDLVGACVIAERVTRPVMLSDKILRFRLAGGAPRWVLYVLRSRHGRNEIERLATGNQESMRNIGQDRIRQIRVPLPPLAEQHRIVAEVDRLLSMADQTEAAVRAQLARAERLRQAVLKHAFEGKLVPQDPSDEPASALLARLRAERTATESQPSRRRGARRGAAEGEA
jgi:type I restriction enzyme S subunit